MQTPFRPRNLQERQCIAYKKGGQRCRAKTSEGRLFLATRLLRGPPTNDEDDTETMRNIIRQLVCDTHRSKLDILLEGLTREYQPDFDEYRKTCEPEETMIPRLCQRNSKMTFRTKLQSAIKWNQFESGFVYIFTWPYMSGYVKVGCSETTSGERIKQWTKCYPDAVQVYSAPISFPQRAEELIHLQMAKKRRDVSCTLRSCPWTFHDEWFLISVEEMISIVRDYELLFEDPGLYDPDTRRLRGNWDDILSTIHTEAARDINVRTLLDAAETLGLSRALERSTISDSLVIGGSARD